MSAGRTVSDKAKDLSGVAKLQYEIKLKEDYLNKAYRELGKRYYDEHHEESPEDFAEIDAAKEALDDLRQELSEKKGSDLCPKCGASVPKGSDFCNRCGTKLNDMFETED